MQHPDTRQESTSSSDERKAGPSKENCTWLRNSAVVALRRTIRRRIGRHNIYTTPLKHIGTYVPEFARNYLFPYVKCNAPQYWNAQQIQIPFKNACIQVDSSQASFTGLRSHALQSSTNTCSNNAWISDRPRIL